MDTKFNAIQYYDCHSFRHLKIQELHPRQEVVTKYARQPSPNYQHRRPGHIPTFIQYQYDVRRAFVSTSSSFLCLYDICMRPASLFICIALCPIFSSFDVLVVIALMTLLPWLTLPCRSTVPINPI